MQHHDLRDYVKIIYDLEKSKYKQEQVIKELQSEIAGYKGKLSARYYAAPTDNRAVPENRGQIRVNAFEKFMIGAVLTFIIEIVCDSTGMITLPRTLDLTPLIPCLVVGLIFAFLSVTVSYGERIQESEKRNQAYQTAISRTEAMNNQISADRNYARRQLARLDPFCDQVMDDYEKTVDLLNKYYAQGIIHKNYQGLIPISYIYESLETEKCYTLTGPDGAYRLYDNDRRMDRIITGVESIEKRMDLLQQNQQALFEIVCEARDTQKKIASAVQQHTQQLDSINRNMDVLNYKADIANAHLAAIENYAAYTAWNSTSW